MATTFRAVFDRTVFRPERPLDLKPGATYLMTIEPAPDPEPAPRPAMSTSTEHPLTQIRRLATDMGVHDLSINHDWYAHGQVGADWRPDRAGATPMAPTNRPLEERITLYDVSWETYQSLLADHVDRQTPRLTYNRGTLEIVGSLSLPREESNAILWSFVEHAATEWSLDTYCVGSMTFVHPGLRLGFSPDTAFYIQHAPHLRRVGQIDPNIHPPPDLVIEIDVSTDSLDKLPVYAGFGVPEVWRVRDGDVTVYTLRPDGTGEYDAAGPSVVLPPLDGETLTRFLSESTATGRVAWLRSVRAWAQSAAG